MPKALNTLDIDVRKGVCILDGVDISKETSELHLDFENGKWSLSVTRTSVYTNNDQASTE